MENTKVLNYLKVIVFNIAEIIIVFLLGNVFNVEINIRIMFMVLFFLTRMIIGKPKHYSKAYKCAIWSVLVFLSLYSLSSLDFIVIVLLTVFTGFISTGRADIDDMFMWKGRDTKYRDIEEYIKYNSMSDELIDFEKKLKEQDNLLFLIYKYKFKESMTYTEMSEKLSLDNPRITEKLDRIALSIRIYCGI